MNLGVPWQADAFDLIGVPMIESALAGFNSSLVCYGQVPPLIHPSCSVWSYVFFFFFLRYCF
jgi:hypothetical protein